MSIYGDERHVNFSDNLSFVYTKLSAKNKIKN